MSLFGSIFGKKRPSSEPGAPNVHVQNFMDYATTPRGQSQRYVETHPELLEHEAMLSVADFLGKLMAVTDPTDSEMRIALPQLILRFKILERSLRIGVAGAFAEIE